MTRMCQCLVSLYAEHPIYYNICAGMLEHCSTILKTNHKILRLLRLQYYSKTHISIYESTITCLKQVLQANNIYKFISNITQHAIYHHKDGTISLVDEEKIVVLNIYPKDMCTEASTVV
jgi:regulator of sigma D